MNKKGLTKRELKEIYKRLRKIPEEIEEVHNEFVNKVRIKNG